MVALAGMTLTEAALVMIDLLYAVFALSFLICFFEKKMLMSRRYAFWGFKVDMIDCYLNKSLEFWFF